MEVVEEEEDQAGAADPGIWITSRIGTAPSVWCLTSSEGRTASNATHRERKVNAVETVGMRSAMS